MASIQIILQRQRCFYAKGKTRSPEFRIRQLKALYASIRRHEADVTAALKADLSKSEFEAYESEIGFVYQEIRHTVKNLRQWDLPKPVTPSLLHFPASGKLIREPYGSVLIMSPWNYPFQLALVPLIGSIAGGNCTVVKPSAYAPETAKVVKTILEELFPPSYVAVILGGREANRDLLEQKFDYIFFTGSPAVGHAVMEAASRNLTPLTLELGGKSPCIVDETADIPLAARRIAWGKFINAGQTCIAPDYILVQESVKESLVQAIAWNIRKFYGAHPEQNPDYPKIINQKHFDRLCALQDSGHLLSGGARNEETLKIAPSILDGVSWESPLMQEEIFGPLLPVMTFRSIDQIIAPILSQPKPLALYLFTTDKKAEARILRDISFGGGCVNDTIIHIANQNMPFGGVGNSGMGQYHGKASYETFTHQKAVVKKSNLLDIGLRYPPFGNHIRLLKLLMK